MKLNHLLLGIVVCLAVLLWQNTEALKAQATSYPSLDVSMVRWISSTGTVRNQTWAGSINIGDETIFADPGTNAWTECRTKIPSSSIYATCSNKRGMPVGNTVVYAAEGPTLHVEGQFRPGLIYGWYDPGDSPTNDYTDLWPDTLPTLRGMIGYNVRNGAVGVTTPLSAYICFSPPNTNSQHTNYLDACVERVGDKMHPDLKFTAGSKYVLLSELVRLLGR